MRADTSPMELSALGEHLQHCARRARPRWFALRCAAEALNGFVARASSPPWPLLALPLLVLALLL